MAAEGRKVESTEAYQTEKIAEMYASLSPANKRYIYGEIIRIKDIEQKEKKLKGGEINGKEE